MTIEQRAFGNTGLRISVLGLGTAELGFSGTSDTTAETILGEAGEAGINVIDTAAMYNDAEAQLGRLLSGRRQQFLIFTKCGRHLPVLTGFPRVARRLRRSAGRLLRRPALEWHPATLLANIEQSLRRLRTDCIDLIQLHSCSQELLERGDVIDALQRARDAGKVRLIGYSGDGPAALWAVRSGLFQAIQLSINVADQLALDDVIPGALQRGMGIIAKRPIANAVWRSAELPREERLQVYWHRMRMLNYPFLAGPDAIATALQFTLRTGAHTAIVGTTSLDHMRSNINAVRTMAGDNKQFNMIRERWRQVAGPDWITQM